MMMIVEWEQKNVTQWRWRIIINVKSERMIMKVGGDGDAGLKMMMMMNHREATWSSSSPHLYPRGYIKNTDALIIGTVKRHFKWFNWFPLNNLFNIITILMMRNMMNIYHPPNDDNLPHGLVPIVIIVFVTINE